MKIEIIGVPHKGASQEGSSLLAMPDMLREMHLLGFVPQEHTVADDEQMEQALRRAVAPGSLVLCVFSGNPQIDAVFSEEIAQVCGVGLVTDETCARRLARKQHLSAQEAARLAQVPQGARVFATAGAGLPGFELSGDRCCVLALPADPLEQGAVFFRRVFPMLSQNSPVPHASRVLRVMELSYGQVCGALRDMARSQNPCVSVYQRQSELLVRVLASGQDREQAAAACTSAVRTAVQRLGSYVYGVDVSSIEHALLLKAAKKGLRVSVAESGTDGRAAARLSAVKAVPFSGESYVCQPQQMDLEPLGISNKFLRKFGPVSANVAAALALGIAGEEKGTIGIGISLPNQEVNAPRCYLAVTCQDGCLARELKLSDYRNVSAMIEDAVSQAMNLARRFADCYPELPKGAVPVREMILFGINRPNVTAQEGPAALAARPAAPISRPKEAEPVKKAKTKKGLLSRIFPSRGDSGFEVVRKILLLLCICVFIGSMTYLVKFKTDSIASEKNISNLQQQMDQAEKDAESGNTVTIEGYPEDYLPKFASFYEVNEDIKGWIKIPNTNVNFPVVQTTDNDYYHRLNFQKEYDYYGTPYIDYECDVKKPSTNIIIYGHNIKADGQMFNDLTKYKNLDFYKQNPVVNFDSVYREGKYKIIGAFITNAQAEQDNGNLFNYVSFVNADTEEEFNAFIDEVRKRSIFDTTVDVEYGDELLTLSTCTYEFRPEARFAVVARRVRDGESEEVDVSGAKINADAYYPQAYRDAMNQASLYGKVKGISIDGAKERTMKVGETLTLKATTDPADAPINTCTWDSSNKAVATVDRTTGVVTAVGDGTVTITAVAEDGGAVANVTIQVTGTGITPEKLTLSTSQLTIQPNKSATLTAGFSPAGAVAGLTWSSSDPSVVQVQDNGTTATLIGGKEGTARITVSTNDGSLSATCSVTVSSDTTLQGVYLPETLSVAVGKSQTVTLQTNPAGLSVGTVSWNWDGGSCLTVKEGSDPSTVTITGVSEGSGVLSAETADGMRAYCEITVGGAGGSGNSASANGVKLKLNDLTLAPDSDGYMDYTVSPGSTQLVWTSSNPRVADVDNTGYITTGSVTETTVVIITAATRDGAVQASAKVTVYVEGSSGSGSGSGNLKVSAQGMTFDIADGPQSLDIRVQSDSDDISVVCKSDNRNIQVNNNGDITAREPGTANITITATDNQTGKTTSTTVTVTVLGRDDPESGSGNDETDSGSDEDEGSGSSIGEDGGWVIG